MERPYPSVQFESEVSPDGTMKVPSSIARRLKPGVRVTVRLTDGIVSKTLKERQVTEDEIEHISALQLEQRENVIRFLEAEGGLADDRSFRKRAIALRGERP